MASGSLFTKTVPLTREPRGRPCEPIKRELSDRLRFSDAVEWQFISGRILRESPAYCRF